MSPSKAHPPVVARVGSLEMVPKEEMAEKVPKAEKEVAEKALPEVASEELASGEGLPALPLDAP